MNKIGKLAWVLFFGIGNTFAQTNKATTARIMAAKNYTFVANSANPLNSADVNNILRQMPGNANGGSINLSGSNYDVQITPDSIVAYLPYYGRAFAAPTSADENGYKFKSKTFTYSATTTKKGGWEILMQTKDVKDSPKLSLSISENGYATLNIISNNKQAISYNGYLKAEQTEN